MEGLRRADRPEPRAPFVARERELARLDALLADALGGRLAVGFVVGEPGAGKTALVNEFARRAQAVHADLLVAVGDCDAQSGVGDPFLPFREILSQLTGDVDGKLAEGAISRENASRLRGFVRSSGRVLVEFGPALVDVFVPGSELLAKLGARVARRFGWMDQLATLVERKAAAGDGAPSLQPDQLFEQYTNVLRTMSAERPLLLVLDDLHWVDAPSAGLLFHLCRRVAAHRTLIVGTYRPAEVEIGRAGDRHPLAPVLAELKRLFGDVWVNLDGIEDAESRRVVDELVDSEPNDLGAGFRDRLHRITGGHPLFTVELLRTLRERGDLRLDPEGRWSARPELEWSLLPARIEGVIEERIGRLPDDLRRLLSAAAVEGEEFTAEAAARAEGVDEREAVRRLSGELDRKHHLVAARGVGRVDGRRLSLYRFRHNLFQGWLYARLDGVERSRLHEDVGRALEALYAGATGEIAAGLARHFIEAGDDEKGVAYLLEAGDRALRLFAPGEAVRHFRDAAALVGRVTPERRPAGWTLRLHEGLGEALDLTGGHEEARASYDRALADASTSDPIARARLTRRIGDSLHAQHRSAEGAEAYEEALRLLGAPDDARPREWWAEWIETQLARVWAFYFLRPADEIAALVQEVRPRVERYGTAVQRARLLQRSTLIEFRRERYAFSRGTVELCADAYAVARESGDAQLLVETQFAVGFSRLWHGDRDGARAGLEAALDRAERAGYSFYRILCLTYLAVLHRLAGDVEAVRGLAERASTEAASAGVLTYAAVARGQLAWVAWREGRDAEAAVLAGEALDALQRSPVRYPFYWIPLLARIRIALAVDRVADAAADARLLLDPAQQRLPDELDGALREACEAEAGGEVGRAAEALRRGVGTAARLGFL